MFFVYNFIIIVYNIIVNKNNESVIKMKKKIYKMPLEQIKMKEKTYKLPLEQIEMEKKIYKLPLKQIQENNQFDKKYGYEKKRRKINSALLKKYRDKNKEKVIVTNDKTRLRSLYFPKEIQSQLEVEPDVVMNRKDFYTAMNEFLANDGELDKILVRKTITTAKPNGGKYYSIITSSNNLLRNYQDQDEETQKFIKDNIEKLIKDINKEGKKVVFNDGVDTDKIEEILENNPRPKIKTDDAGANYREKQRLLLIRGFFFPNAKEEEKYSKRLEWELNQEDFYRAIKGMLNGRPVYKYSVRRNLLNADAGYTRTLFSIIKYLEFYNKKKYRNEVVQTAFEKLIADIEAHPETFSFVKKA